MLTAKIEEIVKLERTCHQDDIVRKLLKLGIEFNIESVFRILRKLGEDGKIIHLGGGFWRVVPKEDTESERITKWF